MEFLPNGSSTLEGALVVLPSSDNLNDGDDTAHLTTLTSIWRPILSDSSQVVLYNPTNHALTVRPHNALPPITASPPGSCPFCHRLLGVSDSPEAPRTFFDTDPRHSRAANYFHLLEVANETSSRPASPGFSDTVLEARVSRVSTSSDTSSKLVSRSRSRDGNVGVSRSKSREPRNGSTFKPGSMAEGYFNAFFKEEYRLGMGANGSVYLCQHVLDGNPLGHFAVKKIAVGESHSYLYRTLREVRLLETLRHPNIVTYHHAWLESCQFSMFGPKVPTLYVLMQWAEGGSLDDFIDARLGKPHSHPGHPHSHDGSPTPSRNGADTPDDARARAARIKAFREAQRARTNANATLLANGSSPSHGDDRAGKRSNAPTTAVHLLSAEEAKRLFCDVVTGLAFLHDRSILHLDLKPGNVLLTWDEGSLIPRAMLSDFGTSQDMIQPNRNRSGNTGTLEYCAPESLPTTTGILTPLDSKSDMWSLGMILHRLLFFKLPYRYSSDGDMRSGDAGDMEKLEKEVQCYGGFKSSPSLSASFESRGLPSNYLLLMERLLNKLPKNRPSSEQVLRGIREGNLDPLPPSATAHIPGRGTLVQRPRGCEASTSPILTNGRLHRASEATMSDDTSDDELGFLARRNTFSAGDNDDVAPIDGSQMKISRSNGKWRHSTSTARSRTWPKPGIPLDEKSRSGELDERGMFGLGLDIDGTPTPRLALPSPPLVSPTTPRPMPMFAYATLSALLKVWNYPWPWIHTSPYRIARKHTTDWMVRNHITIVKGIKSLLLVAKILMLFDVCPGAQPELAFACFIVAVAVVDMWSDDLWMSVLLGVLHVVILRMHCQNGRCCA